MLRIQATIGLNTYYFASEALDYADRYWEPRISNAFQISREFNSADKTGNKIRTVDISLDNRDGFFNSIYTADGLVNGKFVLYFNEGDNVVKTFTGRVNKINSFGDDISLTIREVGYEYLTRKFPDAQIAYDYYSTSGINESWNAIPIHFGTVNRYPCPWVNLFYSHFIIGSGPIHSVKKIYFDKTVVYDSSTGKNGYKPTPESPEIKFRIFKGARAGQTDIVDGIESPYRGFAFIQLYKIVNSVEEPADPVNPDGEAVQIYVDIEGIQNEAGNGPERNPAQILYQCFTKPYTAEEGYGLAIPPADLDFSDAITECGIQGFKIDGSIDNTTDFGEWIDEILRCCRGQLYENNGKISVRIDAAAAAPSIHFDETGELGYNCIVDTWTEPERDAQTNRVRLSYSWNFENSNFNKKPSYNQESPLGDTHLQNPTHANRIQKWNTETLEYKLIKDDTTAHKLAQYYLNNIVKQLITTSLTTEVDIPNTVDAGTVVKVTSPKYGWNQKLFRITNISRAEENTEIKLKEYDASVFTFYNPGTGAETSNNQYSVYNIPAKPKLTSLAVVNEILADGSTQTRINVNFIAPTENSQLVSLYYKTAGGTEADFRPLDTALSSAGTLSAIWKGIESGNYNFRLVTISPVGIYSDLSIVSGDKHYYGQPGSETTVALTGDTIAPGKPLITDYLLGQGVVTLSFDITGGVPSDFSHFAVYRKLNGGSLELIDAKYTGRLFTDTDVASYVSRQYSIVAYDKSNNPSDSSDLTVALTPLKIATNDIQAGAITSETITSNAIYGKCFMTNCNVSSGVAGVIFDSAGIRAYSTTANTFNMDAMTGNVSISGTICALAGNIGGFCADPTEGLYAGAGTTRVQMKPGAGFWAGATAQVDAPFSVDQTGAFRSTSGSIGGWAINFAEMYNCGAWGGLALNSLYHSIYTHRIDTNSGEWMGQIYLGGWTCRYGLAVTRNSAYIFRSDTDIDGNNACNQIAGWDFNDSQIRKTNIDGVLNRKVEVNSTCKSIHYYQGNANSGAFLGQIFDTSWSGRYGLGVTKDGVPIFEVSHDGAGNLTSQIAGWNFNSNSLWRGSVQSGTAPNDHRISLNNTSAAGTIYYDNFTSKGLTIQWHKTGVHNGFVQVGQLFDYSSNNGTPNNFYGIEMRYGGAAANLAFRLSADVTGAADAVCNVIAGWNFNTTCLWSTSCGLILNAAGAIQTGDFVTGNKGWKIDCNGNAEFNNICARGAIRTAVFIKDQISVVGGCTLIRPAGVTCLPNYACSDYSFVFESTEQFNVGDIIRVKDGSNDWWGTVNFKNDHAVNATFNSGVYGWYHQPGQPVVNYGPANSGGIMLNGQCPYIDLYTHDGTPWNGTNSRVRIGNLNGWGSFGVTYGIAIGCPTGNYMTFDTASSTLNIKGVINIVDGSSGIGSFSDANIDNIADGSTYKRTTETEKDGAGKGYYGLIAAGSLIALARHDTRSLNCAPSAYPMGTTNEFKCAYVIGISSDPYGNLTTEKPWADSSGGYAVQTYKDSQGVWERRAEGGATSWGTWYKITDGTGSLRSRVIPSQNAAPAGAGLHLGADYLGYYDGGNWKSYMDNSGRFYLNGASGGLAWDGSVLTVCGTVCSSAGNIAGWSIDTGYLAKTVTSTVALSAACLSIFRHSPDVNHGEWLGQIYNNGAWTGRYGIAVTRGAGVYYFRSDTDINGNNICNQIAGWDFNADGLYKSFGCSGLCLTAGTGSVYAWGTCGGGTYAMMGQMYWNDSWGQNATGFSVSTSLAGTLAAGMGVSTTGNTTLPDGSVSLQCNAFFWAGCATEHVKYVNGKLTVRGDLEVVGNGNILPDPDFRGVPYNSDYTGVGDGGIVGEYCVTIEGCAAVYTAYRGEWRANQYARPNSNAIWLYAAGSDHYAKFMSLNFIPVKGSAKYTLSGYVAKHSGYDNPTVYLGLEYYDASFNYISYDYQTLWGYSLGQTTPTRFSGVKTMPSNAAYVKVIAFNYHPVGPSHVYFSGLQLEEGATLTAWKCNQGGTITANSIKSGALQSLNWNGSNVGSCINMDNGTFNFGGGKLTFDGTTLGVNGTITSNFGLIAGWNFNANCLYSNNILINNNGSIYSNNYATGSAGWRINGAGEAEFNNVTVRGTVYANNGNFSGTVCACCGCIAGFSLERYEGYDWATMCGDFTSSTTNGYNISRTEFRRGGKFGIQWIHPHLYFYQNYNSSGTCNSVTTKISGSDGSSAYFAPIYACIQVSSSCYGVYTNARVYASAFCVVSDCNLKTDFQEVNVLNLLRQLPITMWRFKDSKDFQIGPVAQDFNTIFKLSHDWQTNLTVGGIDGIALKAAKEIDENMQENMYCIAKIESENISLKECILSIESRLKLIEESLSV